MHMYADLKLQADLLKDALGKSDRRDGRSTGRANGSSKDQGGSGVFQETIYI